MRRFFFIVTTVAALWTGGTQMMPAQEMTLDEAIATARSSSVKALEARQAFISTYWAWRSYQASRLPSFILYGNLMNYDRSLALLQSPDDGSMKYVSTHNLQNSLGLRVAQNIPWTGGTLYLYSDLNRIDQYGAEKALTWYAQPVTLSYNQPLFAYNQFKWDKLIEPREYERGRRTYLESMEDVTLAAVKAYFGLLEAQEQESMARTNLVNTRRMLQIAGERLSLGTVTRDEYLQLELRMLNDSIAIHESALLVRESQMGLNSLLGFDEESQIRPVMEDRFPLLTLDYDEVLDRALENSRFNLDNEISLLEARSSVEKAKAERGVTMSFNARFGLSKSGEAFRGAYYNPLDQEVFGLSFTVPIFDWGLGRGKVQKARAAEEVVKAQVQQGENDYRRKVFTDVGQFNKQQSQCAVSRRAMEIALERYELMMERFREGSATVTDLNTARSESDAARRKYVGDVGRYWQYYYEIRKETLHDFMEGADLVVDENEMTGNL